MQLVSRVALSVAFAIGATALGGTAAAQRNEAPAGPVFSKDERAALSAAQTALQQRNYAAAAPAIAAAKSRARTPEARYLAASFELRLGLETNDRKVQADAIDAMIASGAAPAGTLEELYKNQGALALSAGKLERAEAAFTRWAEVAPGSAEALVALAEVKDDRKKVPEAVALIDRAIGLRQAAGQRAPESWYKRGLKHAFDTKLGAETIKFSQGLVNAYPSPGNWRDVLLAYSDLAGPDPAAKIDVMRLMRSANALGGERDYLELAEALNKSGLPGESKAVLDQGVSAKMVDPSKAVFKELIASSAKAAAADRKALAASATKAMAAATGEAALDAGDEHLALGEYAKAADLYRAALEKGGVDSNLVNTRLGMALAQAGKKAEAEAALRAVTGPRTNLASYWLLWLGQRG